MAMMTLADRAVIRVSGDDAGSFLQGLLTADIEGIARGGCVPAALLTPQGKVLFDMLLWQSGQPADGFAIDCAKSLAEALATRLGFYRLRSKVEIETMPEMAVAWSPEGGEDGMGPDPRHPSLGFRGIAETPAGEDGAAAYHATRIALGIAEAGADYGEGEVFAHEANLDLLGGVSFTKGCFIGQEVVSRMHHRGTARKRFLPCAVEGAVLALGTDVTVGERTIGSTGSCADGHVLALVRLDHLEAATREGTPVMAGEARLLPSIPDWLAPAAGALAGELT